MTEELYNRFVEKIREEIRDIREYQNLLPMATGYSSAVLNGIIRDEKSHAKYLLKAIEEAGRPAPADLKAEYMGLTNFRRI